MSAFPLLVGALLSLTGPGPGPGSTPPRRWGEDGHRMAARAAAEALPTGMPAFFAAAGEQLAYLDPEPDRWRSRPLREMDQAFSYDHYIDLENVPEGALDAPDRWVFLKRLYDAGIARPERDAGFLPFRILELYQRLVTEWRLWRDERDPRTKAWIEQRIINDAGVLGHYATDASNPHHSTIHFNGWSAGAPNPHGYTTDRGFHGRFESDFVRAFVRYEDVRGRVPPRPRDLAGAARPAVMAEIRTSNGQVETLYRLEKDVGFDPSGPLRRRTRDFAADRLAAGAAMLRDLWWSAWRESAQPPDDARPANGNLAISGHVIGVEPVARPPMRAGRAEAALRSMEAGHGRARPRTLWRGGPQADDLRSGQRDGPAQGGRYETPGVVP